MSQLNYKIGAKSTRNERKRGRPALSEIRTPKSNNLSPYFIKMFIVLLTNQKDYGLICHRGGKKGSVVVFVIIVLSAGKPQIAVGDKVARQTR